MILTYDDFFEEPHKVREAALKEKYYTPWELEDFKIQMKSYFPGKRSNYLDKHFFFRELQEKFYDIISKRFEYEFIPDAHYYINTHFQYTTEGTIGSIHRDTSTSLDYEPSRHISAVIYLNPDMEEEYGTPFYDNSKGDGKLVVPAKFNRICIFDGDEHWHGKFKSFGNDVNNARLVVSIFGYLR